ncbi:hypothetical protein DITRI_Ditri20bG0129900 [Diplodiscus trichospermus]
MLMHKGIPGDIRWLIEAKVRLAGDSSNSFVSYMPGLGKISYEKKRRAKRLQVCHKCARWTYNKRYCSLEYSRESDSKRPYLPVYKKTGWEAYPRIIESVQTALDVKPEEDATRRLLIILIVKQNAKFVEAANTLDRVLAKRKIYLVNGGGSLGLMEYVSTVAHVSGSQVLGIIPIAIAKGNIVRKIVGEELRVPTMQDRI